MRRAGVGYLEAMASINDDYRKLQAGYLFPEIGRRVRVFSEANPDTSVIRLGIGDVTLPLIPRPHGDHVHIGGFTVSTRDASGLANPAVWSALARKGLARADDPIAVTLTATGLSYDTGLGDRFVSPSDH